MTALSHILAAQAAMFKALGHPVRLRMLEALRGGEKCVGELQALTGQDMSTVSRHLAVLREACIVEVERRGTNRHYRIALRCLDTFLACSAEAIRQRAHNQLARLGE